MQRWLKQTPCLKAAYSLEVRQVIMFQNIV